MANGIDWFRWHHGSVTDPKFALIARRAEARLGDVIAVWAYLLEKASAADFRGCFGAIDCEAVDCLLGMDDGTTAAILAQMEGRQLVADEYIVAWEKRQPKRERTDDSSAARTRSYRDRQAASSDATQNHVTPCDAKQSQETPREDKRREEVIQTPPSGGVARKRASRKAPASFAVDESMRQWLADSGITADPEAETAKFRDYTFKNPITDWVGAWRNWMRGANTFAQARASPTETPYARSMREKYEKLAPGIAARAPGQTKQIFDCEVVDATPKLMG